MPPVLSGTPWLAIHVPIIMVSYSTFAIATFLAHLVRSGVAALRAPARGRAGDERGTSSLYWYMHVGSILLIAGILTGSIWAASSWGRYWGWDPKEVWSLVAFLAYMAILHARIDGQIGSFGVARGRIVAFWTILMTYLGRELRPRLGAALLRLRQRQPPQHHDGRRAARGRLHRRGLARREHEGRARGAGEGVARDRCGR